MLVPECQREGQLEVSAWRGRVWSSRWEDPLLAEAQGGEKEVVAVAIFLGNAHGQ